MAVYTENYKGFNGTHRWTGQRTYRQARWRHMVGHVLHVVTVSRLWIKVEDVVAPVTRWWHMRHCNDDCRTGLATRRELGSPDVIRSVETYCGRTPFGVAVDIWVYRFCERGRVMLSTQESARVPG